MQPFTVGLLVLTLSLGVVAPLLPVTPSDPVEGRIIGEGPDPFDRVGVTEGPDPIPQAKDDGSE